MRTFKNVGKAALVVMLLTAIVISMAVLVRIAKAVPVDTYHSEWKLIRDTAAEDAIDFATALALATGEGDFAHMTASRFLIPHRDEQMGNEGYSPGGAWKFVFCGTDTVDHTFSFTLVGWAKENGMAQVICEGDGVLGSQDVVLYPDDGATATSAFWADTISLDETTKWPSVAVYNSGANEVAFVLVDMTGLEYVYPYIYDAESTTGDHAHTITVYGRRY